MYGMGKRSTGDGNQAVVTWAAAAGNAAQRRRVVAWLVASAAVLGILMTVAAGVSWYCLPEWAPEWVVQHSPWVGPMLRAERQLRYTLQEPSSGFAVRIRALGQRAGPGLEAGLHDSVLDIRLLALEGLQYISYGPAAPRLIELMDADHLDEAGTAERALHAVDDPGATPAVVAGLAHAGATGVDEEPLLDWLCAHGGRHALLPVAKVFFQRDYDGDYTRFDFGALLDRMRGTGDRAVICAEARPLLASSRPAWRIAAVWIIARLGARDELPALVPRLVDEDGKVREYAGAVLCGLDETAPGATAALVPALLRLLEPRSGPSRKEVVRVLENVRDLQVEQSLIRLLRARAWDPETRCSAIRHLRDCTDPVFVTTMCEALAGPRAEIDVQIRVAAACTLGLGLSTAAPPALVAACSDPAARVRASALRALRPMCDLEADRLALPAMTDADEEVRWEAISLIANHGRPAGVAALIALIAAAEHGPMPMFLSVAERQPWWTAADRLLYCSTCTFDAAQRAVLDAARSRMAEVDRMRRTAELRATSPTATPFLVQP